MTVRKIEALQALQESEVKKIRVAAYCRVSTENEDQRESLEAQKAHYESWIKLHSDWEFAGVFYDFGITGTKADVRDGLQALMYECRRGHIDYVLTKSVSRFSRNTSDCLSLVRELLSYNIPIYFEKENLDTGSMDSELILSVLSGMAQDESVSISKNVKWTIQKRIENGTYKFGYPPYGYKRDEQGLMVIDPQEAEIIRFIFKSALNGSGTYKIAQLLQERGAPTRKGSRWSSSTVKGILTNEKYYGAAMFQKTFTDNQFKRHANNGQVDSYFVLDHHEPIISKEDFDKVQQLFQMRIEERGIIKGTGKYHNQYPFSGRIICGECGDKFKRQVYSTDINWCCQTHLTDKSRCSMLFIRDSSIKAAFVTMLNKLIFGCKVILLPLYDSMRISGSDENLKRLHSLKSSLEQNAERKNTLRKLRAQGFIDSVIYNQEISKIEKQSEEYRAEILALSQTDTSIALQETEKLLRFAEKSEMQTEFSDSLFSEFVDSIIVYTRTSIGFRLKCGLTLKEELCTGTK